MIGSTPMPPPLPLQKKKKNPFYWFPHQSSTLLAELAERSPIIIQNSSDPSSRKNLDVQPYDCTTVQDATFSMRGQLYHGHYLIISPLHGHGEVANENPLILPRTLSIVGALVLLKRSAEKKNASSAFRLA